MSNDLVCARGDLDIQAAIKLMIHHRIGCLPVVDHLRRPVGMLTKFDLVERLQRPANERARSVEEVMMPFALTLRERSTVGEAATMMKLEDTHHVLVVADDGRLCGVVSTRDIVVWVVDSKLAASAQLQ